MPTLTPETRARLREILKSPLRITQIYEIRNALPALLADSDALAAVTAERDRVRGRAEWAEQESEGALKREKMLKEILQQVEAERDRLREALQRMVEKCSECNGFGRLHVPDKTLTGRKSIPCNLCGQARELLGGHGK